MAELVNNPPAMLETWVQSLGWEDPLETERLPTPVFWPGEFRGLYSPWGCNESDTTERLSLHFSPFECKVTILLIFMYLGEERWIQNCSVKVLVEKKSQGSY